MAFHHQQPISVAIIEDDSMIRESYSYLISHAEGFEVAGAYKSYEEAARHLLNIKPDVILLDVELPGINGVEAIPKIKKILAGVHILILTVYENNETVFNALTNGASGYLTKNTPSQKIIEAIKEVVEGGAPMSAGVARLVINSFQRNQNSPLSKRETEVLENVALGKSRRRIADELFIDMETVKTHIKNIYQKLDVHSKADAIKTAKENKFI
jgi:DNA-binding NarL/FixJ family response regulator